jgi:protein SCO1/2
MYFGYTKCPDICPTTLQYLSKVVGNIKKNEAQQTNLKIVFVSVDPQRDNPEDMKNYIKLFS